MFMNIIYLSLVVVCLFQQYHSFGTSGNSMSRTKISSRFLEMKKKGGKIPIDQRGEFLKRQKLMEQRENMKKDEPKDVPVFEIFVRPKAGGVWFPCGSLAGDQRATALVNAWTSGFMADMYKGQLDRGIARSIFNQEDTFVKGITENYKPFKKFTKEDLEFGYKIKFTGLEEKLGEQKILAVAKGMEKGWFDNLKESVTGAIAETFGTKPVENK